MFFLRNILIPFAIAGKSLRTRWVPFCYPR